MNITLGNWAAIILFSLLTLMLSLYISLVSAWHKRARHFIIPLCITIIVFSSILFGCHWYNTHTASGARAYKNYQSEIANGIDRTITILADDGMILYQHTGKFDVDITDNYLVFDEEGQRTVISKSYTTTILIEETN